MKPNKRLRDAFFEVVDNQIKANDPPETAEAMKRLKEQGYSEFEAKQLIGQCIALETFMIMKHGQEHNPERYIRNLSNLPKEPEE
ncbi:MAG: hypothetical protein IPM38_11625 [Ignavibacteria bacterium]|nr:hypothetical protein [Ignavibacteria bacterium]